MCGYPGINYCRLTTDSNIEAIMKIYTLKEYCKLYHSGNWSSLARALDITPQRMYNMRNRAVSDYYVTHDKGDMIVFPISYRRAL